MHSDIDRQAADGSDDEDILSHRIEGVACITIERPKTLTKWIDALIEERPADLERSPGHP